MTFLMAVLSIALVCMSMGCTESTQPRDGFAEELEVVAMPDSAFLLLSDSTPMPGSIITVTAYAPRLNDNRRIASYEANLQFDTTGLTIVEEPVSSLEGLQAMNMDGDIFRAAAASIDGLRDRVLFSVVLKVGAQTAIPSLRLSVKHLSVIGESGQRPLIPRNTHGLITPFSESESVQYGDINGDETISAIDALFILQISAGLIPVTETTQITADLNNDAEVSAIDAQIVLAYVVGENVRRFRVGDLLSAPTVRVMSISPAVLHPGTEAVITGEHFSAIAEDDTVLVDDIVASVISASTTQLMIRVPSNLPCEPAHSGSVLVRVGGGGGHRFHPVSAAFLLPMSVGETRILGPNDHLSCLEIPENAKYVMAVYNPHNARMSSYTFRVIGDRNQGMTSFAEQRITSQGKAPLKTVLSPSSPPANTSAFNLMRNALGTHSPAHRLQEQMLKHQVAHHRMMEQESALLRRLPTPGGASSRVSSKRSSSNPPGSPALSVSPTIGAYSSIKVHDSYGYDTYTTVRARTVYVGVNCIVLEDSTSALAGTIDSYYRKLGIEFDQITMPMLRQYFGNPLAMDAQMDNNGKIIMLFSPVINQKFSNLSGFVTSCDFLSTAMCASSNQAEIFYAKVPINSATDYSEGSVSEWFWTIRSIIPHEAKHITSLAERFARGGVAESSWLEEGTAQIASELYGRHFFGASAAWKENAVYANTLYCEYRPSIPQCLDHPTVMRNHFGWLSDYVWNTDSYSPISTVTTNVYGSAWLLVRWAADMYASSEAGFFRELTQQSVDTGIVNLTARAGKTWSALLGGWALAVAADEMRVGGVVQTTHHIPSWNLPNIFQEMSKDLGGVVPASPLRRTTISGGNFWTQRGAAGGSFATFDIELNGDGKQTIGIVSPTNGSIPTNVPLSVALWRAQ